MAAAHPHWTVDQVGRKTWPINGYYFEGESRTDWFVKGVPRSHRTLATTINALIDMGFRLRHIEEFSPARDQVDQSPEFAQEWERPMLLLVSARKPETA
jgi:hypothetical protein